MADESRVWVLKRRDSFGTSPEVFWNSMRQTWVTTVNEATRYPHPDIHERPPSPAVWVRKNLSFLGEIVDKLTRSSVVWRMRSKVCRDENDSPLFWDTRGQFVPLAEASTWTFYDDGKLTPPREITPYFEWVISIDGSALETLENAELLRQRRVQESWALANKQLVERQKVKITAEEALERIMVILAEPEWDSDTASRISEVVRDAGYPHQKISARECVVCGEAMNYMGRTPGGPRRLILHYECTYCDSEEDIPSPELPA